MQDAIISAMFTGFFGITVFFTVLFLGMMIHDDFSKGRETRNEMD